MKPYFSLEKLDLYHGDASVLETFEIGKIGFIPWRCERFRDF